VGRFFAVDPLTGKYPFYSSYQFSGNTVIRFIEFEGLEEGDYYKKYIVDESGEVKLKLVDFVDLGEKADNRMFILDTLADSNTPNRKEYNGQYYEQVLISSNSDIYDDSDINGETITVGETTVQSKYGQYDNDVYAYIYSGGKYTDKNWLQRLILYHKDDDFEDLKEGAEILITRGRAKLASKKLGVKSKKRKRKRKTEEEKIREQEERQKQVMHDKNKSKSKKNRHTDTRAGRNTGNNRNKKRGDNNKKYKMKVNVNKYGNS
jgi:hypothetical protein